MKKFVTESIRDRRGMTLVELMIAISVFGVLMGVVMGFLVESRDSYNETRERAQVQQSMRAVLSLLTAEVRSAGCDPLSAGFESFAFAGDVFLQAQMDLNGDADITDSDPDESVTYVFTSGSGELWRVDAGGSQVILRNLTNVQFSYFDAQGAALAALPLSAADRARVRVVHVLLEGETDQGEPVDYETNIALRNI
jgi:prepilin-type N-terminal cleavage/methylation domain-containing protein